jgi:hypothetical protein
VGEWDGVEHASRTNEDTTNESVFTNFSRSNPTCEPSRSVSYDTERRASLAGNCIPEFDSGMQY